jgi:predicted phosphoadenosine phosphosulfate sulfurtransferase
MSKLKRFNGKDVLTAARERVEYTFDNFENIYVSFSGGKDSSVMMHLVLEEAIKRGRKVGILIIDLEAQYRNTIEHVQEMVEYYKDNVEVHWVCLPMALRNAVSNFEPKWICWDPELEESWVRPLPKDAGVISDCDTFDFFHPGMEFEEFMVLFGEWYGGDQPTAGFVGIRADESLNRFRTIASDKKETHGGHKFTTKVSNNLYNIYPVYDWKTQDIWRFHAHYPHLAHNEVYDLMHRAGLSIHQQRLCQPYGDDQRRGLWLYHVLEPDTWYKVVARVNGVNSGALYIQENGSITGYNKIDKPEGHTWKSFCNLLLATMPTATREHYSERFKQWLGWWAKKGYNKGIPDDAPVNLENKKRVPSWRRLCKVLLRNDWWCKGIGFSQPKSEAYGKYLKIKKEKCCAN